MAGSVSEENLARLSAFVASKMGLLFPKERWRDLERGLGSAALDMDFENSEACLEWLLASPVKRSHIEILASHLTVGETYFFRDQKVFQLLEKVVLPELTQMRRKNGKHLRFWSAGCATGEEPYSVAILLSRIIPDIADWNITILATDINPRFLQKASKGIYGRWSFRGVAPRIIEQYFNKRDDHSLEVLPWIRKMVKFTYLNLVEDTYPSLFNSTTAMDVIFCRNVLMYLAPGWAERIVQNLHRCLLNGGSLIVSPSELSRRIFGQFTILSSAGAAIYRKQSIPRDSEFFSCMPVEKPLDSFEPADGSASDLCAEEKDESGGLGSMARESQDSEGFRPAAASRDNLHREGMAFYERGCYSLAMEKAESLLSENPSDTEAMTLMARICANSGKLADALKCCEKAISIDKLRAGAHYLNATILLELGQTEAAVNSLKRVLYLDPEFILAYIALGNISKQSQKHSESVKYFKNAVELLADLDPEDILPESEGINAARLTEIIESMLQPQDKR